MTTQHMKKTIAVWFSCGAASAVAAKKTIELYGNTHIIRVINNPVREEDSDNRRFLKDVEKWLGVKVEICVNEKFPKASAVEVWDKKKYMSGTLGAPCTVELKKRARQQWEMKNPSDFIVLGFTADEKKRFDTFKKEERDNILPILIDAKITKGDCFKIIQESGIELPRMYKMGYPNANCIGCVKATSATYWNHVRKMNPKVFEARAKQSRRIGTTLVRHMPTAKKLNRKNKKGIIDGRIFLDELPAEAKGRSMKNMDFECGIFCETKL